MHGLIHIYTGEGKGKTTASVGLSIRFAGHGGRVLFTQFLKDDSSSELNILCRIENITFLPSGKSFGFTFQMTPKQKELAKQHYTQYFQTIVTMAENYGLLILDEVIAADNSGLIPHEMLTDFLTHKPEHLEVALTGRNPKKDLLALADYISCIQCQKHPFQTGIPARMGIEK